MKTMEMHIDAIGVDEKSGAPIVMLKDLDNTRLLPIWIGLPEARAITLAANKVVSPRPLTHDLLLETIKRLGYNVKEVVIDNMESHTYLATIILKPQAADTDLPCLEIDARPSDAIALALTAGVPVMVAENIVAEAGMPVPPPSNEKDAEEFSKFLEEVKASDFKYEGKIELPDDEE